MYIESGGIELIMVLEDGLQDIFIGWDVYCIV